MKPQAPYYTCFLLLSIIIILSGHQIHSIEAARGFKLNQENTNSDEGSATFVAVVAPRRVVADAFRPTSPGHSPGIGHHA
ncbi:unnamed protein product [Linum trigynum]